MLRRRVTHLQQQGDPTNTSLAHFKSPRGRWTNVTPTMITSHVKATVKLLAGTHLGFTYKYVSTRSLRAAGTMALLFSGVETDIISLIERWRSDEMLRYLHLQAATRRSSDLSRSRCPCSDNRTPLQTTHTPVSRPLGDVGQMLPPL